ncbi:hypothetical protein [Demequina mangrovi]|uniref:Uncharacterized protein n=1 Tax=Demequina mangrovi TaxID=1043493 RepID=A0A1H6ZS72_9MICO|nr:hypothetical protein [Demequina mangrovi]SEJ56373.1 hypothetical protein SAMN05421637_2207 [Demequina mangrovi]
MSAEPEAWHDAWVATLGELELTLEQAEAMLAADHVPSAEAGGAWTPPVGIGAIPAPLVDRARALLARQVEVSRRLATAAAESRRHDRAIARLAGGPPAPPVYIDVPA